MLKKLTLIVLLAISNLPTLEASKIRFVDRVSLRMNNMASRVRNSHGISLWLGAIIPSILAVISSECVIRSHKQDDKKKDVVVVAKFIRFMSLIVGVFFFDEWWKTDFQTWFTKRFNPKPTLNCPN